MTKNPEAPCPVVNCLAPLYLSITSAIPLYAVNPPWPGAGESTYDASEAVSQGWEVVCTDGHTLWTHVDQIRADNRADPDAEGDETTDYAPLFEFPTFARLVLGDPHKAKRGNDIELWLRRTRDEYPDSKISEGWLAIDGLLDDYLLHADTGTPLNEEP